MNRGDGLKSWIMIALTLVFVVMYGAALIGWLNPPMDASLVIRIEPIIFVIIGYHFGRLPGQQNESTLIDEIKRQTQRADAAQAAKEHAQQARESFEEKIKNVRATLASSAPGGNINRFPEYVERTDGPVVEGALRQSVAAAVSILNS
jgi:hypothetical protein